jgi:hypothetical protein
VQRYKNKLIYANIFLSRRILLQKLRIGFADAIGIVDGIARDEERHCHAMVVAGEVLAHSKQAVGLFDWERVGASGMEGDAEALAGECDCGVEIGAGGEILRYMFINDNINNLRGNRTALPIVREKAR